LICDFRDFYVVNGLFKRVFPLHLLDKLLEQMLMKHSSQLIFISKNMKWVYESKYPAIVSKSNLIYNGYDENDFKNIATTSIANDKLKIFFAGSLYFESSHPRDIFQLLDYLESLIRKGLIDKSKIEIKMAAFIHPNLLQKINLHFMKDYIKLLGVIKREEVLIEMQQANLLWHMLGDSKQDMGAIPIKTFEYMASKKPVLFFVPKHAELEEIANDFKLGYTCFLGNAFDDYNQQIIMKAYQEIVLDKKIFSLDESRFSLFKRNYQATQLAAIINQIN
jgi:glycosyltransferase involved in cell wall biosynthesis